MRIRRSGLVSCVVLSSSLWGVTASAQEPAPAAPPAPPPPPAAPAPAAAPAVAPAAPRDEAPADETSDHDKLAGHFGVGYFGISQIPYASALGGGGLAVANVTAPVVGVRYWMTRQLGIDVGAGLSLSSFSNSTTPAPNPAPQNPPTVFAFALHAGVPIALASAKHFTFEIVPEATFGYATTSINEATPQPNVSVHGLRLDVGGRVGGEINFGFMGLPQLALEASVGLFVRYQNVGASQDAYTNMGNNIPAASASNGVFTLGTSVGSDPWAIFTDNISALYYF
jgi:hypothetical protein